MTGRQGVRLSGVWIDEAHRLELPPLRSPEVAAARWDDIARAAAQPVSALTEALRAMSAASRSLGLHMRRARLVRGMALAFGVTLHPHPRLPHVVVTSASEHAALLDQLTFRASLPLPDGLLRFMGDEVTLWVVPDWTCDATRVARARLYARTVHAPLTRAVRPLTRLLARHTPDPGRPQGGGA